jgi:hypothetical protein
MRERLRRARVVALAIFAAFVLWIAFTQVTGRLMIFGGNDGEPTRSPIVTMREPTGPSRHG